MAALQVGFLARLGRMAIGSLIAEVSGVEKPEYLGLLSAAVFASDEREILCPRAG